MPSSYAHYQFGAQALPTLPADIRFPVQRCRMLFDLGLQGPDFFYFYRFYTASGQDIRDLARQYHYRPGKEVFSKICWELGHPTDAELAYLYGLIGHYCLDSACHPVIHEVSRREDLPHNAMESEFDRFLMERGGVRKPHGYDRSAHLKCGKGCAAVIARFYPEAEPAQIGEGLHTMELILRLLTLHSAAEKVLNMLGGSYPGLLMHRAPDPAFTGENEILLERYNRALAKYPELLQQLHSHMTYGEPFGEDFDPIFG